MGLFGKKKFADPETEAAYNQAYREERLELARQRGLEDARNKKPFYQKLGTIGLALGKDIMNTDFTPKNDPFGVFPTKRRSTRRKKRRR